MGARDRRFGTGCGCSTGSLAGRGLESPPGGGGKMNSRSPGKLEFGRGAGKIGEDREGGERNSQSEGWWGEAESEPRRRAETVEAEEEGKSEEEGCMGAGVRRFTDEEAGQEEPGNRGRGKGSRQR